MNLPHIHIPSQTIHVKSVVCRQPFWSLLCDSERYRRDSGSLLASLGKTSGAKTQIAPTRPLLRRVRERNGMSGDGRNRLGADGAALRHGADAAAEPRDLARGGVLVQHALGHAAHDLRLGVAQRGLGGSLVAGFDSVLDLADEGADAADPAPVDDGAPVVAPDALFRL